LWVIERLRVTLTIQQHPGNSNPDKMIKAGIQAANLLRMREVSELSVLVKPVVPVKCYSQKYNL